jgi:hypothetical protein
MNTNESKNPKFHSVEDRLYMFGMCLLPVLLIVAASYQYLQRYVHMPAVPCLFYLMTGYYCPGCGGTRAMNALLHGRLLKAFAYHPLVGYGAFVYLWFLLSHTLETLSRYKFRIGMKCRPFWLWLALVILVTNVLLRDGALFFEGIDLFAYIP